MQKVFFCDHKGFMPEISDIALGYKPDIPDNRLDMQKLCLFDVLFHKIKSYLSLIFSEVYAFSILNTLGFIQEKNSTSE